MEDLLTPLICIFLLSACLTCDLPVVEIECEIEADFSVTNDGCTAPCTLSFEATSSCGGLSYEWDFGDGTTSTEDQPVHEYTDPNTYTVRLIVSSGSQSDTAEQTVTIQTLGEEVITFRKSYGEVSIDEIPYSVEQTLDGGYFIVGAKNQVIYWLKIDENGNRQWEGTFPGNCTNDGVIRPRGIQVDNTTFLVVGNICQDSEKWATFLKLENNGNTIQQTFIANSSDQEDVGSAFDIVKISTNKYLVSINDQYGTGPNDDVFQFRAVEIDLDGNYSIVYTNTINDLTILSDCHILKTNDNGFLLQWAAVPIFAISYLSTKLDSDFSQEWETNLGSTLDQENYGESVQLENGTIIVVGEKDDKPSLVSLQFGDGTISNRVNHTELEEGTLKGITNAQTENQAIVCGSGSTVLGKVNANLQFIWRKTDLDIPGEFNAVAKTSDGGYILAGTIPNGTTKNMVLVKTDSEGNVNE